MRAEELTNLDSGLASDVFRGLAPRRRMRVTSDALAGMSGEAFRRPASQRWLIAVQPGVWIEIDDAMVESI